MNTEKRLLIAISLSLLVISAWSFATSKLYPPKNQGVIIEKTVAATPKESLSASWQEISVESIAIDGQEISFSLPYATIKDSTFKDYQNQKFDLNRAFLLEDKDLVFKKIQIGQKNTFVSEDKNKRITKELNILNSKYNMELSIIVENLSDSVINMDYPILISSINTQTGHFSERLKEAVFAENEKMTHLSPIRNYETKGEIKFVAFRDRYFCLVVEPTAPGFKGFLKKISGSQGEMGLRYPLQLMPHQTQVLHFRIYLGPQELELLEAANKDWGAVVYYGAFDAIARLLLKGLKAINSLVRNWGLTLILFSIAIYFLLFPLSIKQMRAMRKMQELQPKIEELKAKYKNDTNEMNKKVMELYKEERVNPFSGCLPMVLQIPIFFALYQALIRALELKGGTFLWIKDLSEPDKLFSFAKPIPVIGSDINILPILMMIMMFFQQKMSMSSAANTSSAEQQKIMMIMFPILFGVIFYNMPAGLVLYWFINSMLMFVFQVRTNKIARA